MTRIAIQIHSSVATTAALLVLYVVASTTYCFGQDQQPNLLFIMTDDQGIESIRIDDGDGNDAFGDPIGTFHNVLYDTPLLNTIAKQGIVFTQCRVNPYCSPTRSGILTGRQASNTGAVHVIGSGKRPVQVRNRASLQTYETTIAEVLQQAGYATGLIDKWHCGYAKDSSLNEAFDFQRDQRPEHQGFGGIFGRYRAYQQHIGVWDGQEYQGCAPPFICDLSNDNTSAMDTDRVTTARNDVEAVINEFKSVDPNRPYAMFFWSIDPHSRKKDVPNEGLNWWQAREELLDGDHGGLDAVDYYESGPETNQSRYRAVIDALDSELARLLMRLGVVDSTGKYVESSNTIVIITSDNGTPATGDDGSPVSSYTQFGHPFAPAGWTHGHAKGTLYEGGVRVPLIVFGEGISGAKDVDPTRPVIREDLVSHIDFYETLCDLALVGTDDRGDRPRDSMSFAPVLRDSSNAVGQRAFAINSVINRWYTGGPSNSREAFEAHRVSVTDSKYKMIVNVTGGSFRPREGRPTNSTIIDPQLELYDLVNDPEEQTNLAINPAANHQQIIETMYDALVEEWPTAVCEINENIAPSRWVEIGIRQNDLVALKVDSNGQVIDEVHPPNALPLGYEQSASNDPENEWRIYTKFDMLKLRRLLEDRGVHMADLRSAQIIARFEQDSRDPWWNGETGLEEYLLSDGDTGPIRLFPMRYDVFTGKGNPDDPVNSDMLLGMYDPPPHALYDCYPTLIETFGYDVTESQLSTPNLRPGTPIGFGGDYNILLRVVKRWLKDTPLPKDGGGNIHIERVGGRPNYGIEIRADWLNDLDLEFGDQTILMQALDSMDIRLRVEIGP